MACLDFSVIVNREDLFASISFKFLESEKRLAICTTSVENFQNIIQITKKSKREAFSKHDL